MPGWKRKSHVTGAYRQASSSLGVHAVAGWGTEGLLSRSASAKRKKDGKLWKASGCTAPISTYHVLHIQVRPTSQRGPRLGPPWSGAAEIGADRLPRTQGSLPTQAELTWFTSQSLEPLPLKLGPLLGLSQAHSRQGLPWARGLRVRGVPACEPAPACSSPARCRLPLRVWEACCPRSHGEGACLSLPPDRPHRFFWGKSKFVISYLFASCEAPEWKRKGKTCRCASPCYRTNGEKLSLDCGEKRGWRERGLGPSLALP